VQTADRSVRTALEALLAGVEQRSSQDTFVASFSADGDLLSQWLSYCPEGNGFAIGIETTAMNRTNLACITRISELAAAKKPFNISVPGLRRVFYYSPSNMGFVDALLDVCSGICPPPPLPTLDEAGPLKPLLTAPNLAYLQLGSLEPIVKDESFSAEKECRLVVQGTPERVLFRAGKSMLIPYTTYEFDSTGGYFIDRVIVGPCPDPDLSVKSLRCCSNRLVTRQWK
jgi:hypothetical protein